MLALADTSEAVSSSVERGSAGTRVAIFIPSLRGGGAERAMLLFAEGLLAKGYLVDLLVAQREGPLVSEVPAGARLVDLGERKVSRTLPKLTRYLAREKPSALFSTIVNANLVAVLAAQWVRRVHGFHCRVVVRESNVVSPKGPLSFARRVSGRLAPWLYGYSDAIISVSKDVAAELSTAAPKLSPRIHTLPNPVVSPKIFALSELDSTHPWLHERRNAASNIAAPLIVAAGRLHPQKDFPTLLKAFAILRAERSARLIILGEGEQRAQLEALVTELGLADCVSLPGFAANPYPYFRHADSFVLSSVYEGMPNVMLQALAFGTPVVATRCHSGAQEVLTDAAFGRLVTPGDSQAMAAAISECLRMPRSREAIEFVAEHFSVTHATDEYLRAAGLV